MCEWLVCAHGRKRRYVTIVSHGYIICEEANCRWHREGRDSGGQGMANGTYGHIRISADESVRAACRWDTGCANGSHGSMVGSAIMRRYYRMSTLDSGRQTTDGIVRATLQEGRECTNGTYGHIRISADKSVRAACRWDTGCANTSHGSMVRSASMR